MPIGFGAPPPNSIFSQRSNPADAPEKVPDTWPRRSEIAPNASVLLLDAAVVIHNAVDIEAEFRRDFVSHPPNVAMLLGMIVAPWALTLSLCRHALDAYREVGWDNLKLICERYASAI